MKNLFLMGNEKIFYQKHKIIYFQEEARTF